MPVTKRIICLANSRKLSGRCIAGIEISDANQAVEWIRPVSDRVEEEVSEHERAYEDGSDPKVLDIIDIPLIKPRPREFQQENWLLDPEYYWEKSGVWAWQQLQAMVGAHQPLWDNGHRTRNGVNDKLPLENANNQDHSLRLIHVPNLKLSVFSPGSAFGNPKRRVQGQFSYLNTQYHLWVTDPVYERNYLAMPNGDYNVGESYLTISLGEPYKYDNYACYKLIAAIIERG